MKGLFITFEGPEGAGKTTQISRIARFLQKERIPYLSVREPGGTEIGYRIREILLDPHSEGIVPEAEMLLYAASRAQLISEKIRPALDDGKIVLCDRYLDSSVVYQGYASLMKVQSVIQVNQIATNGLEADRTYLLDLPVNIGLTRSGRADRIEQKTETFHQRVRTGYRTLAQQNPERIKMIQADQDVEKVYQEIFLDFQYLIQNRESSAKMQR